MQKLPIVSKKNNNLYTFQKSVPMQTGKHILKVRYQNKEISSTFLIKKQPLKKTWKTHSNVQLEYHYSANKNITNSHYPYGYGTFFMDIEAQKDDQKNYFWTYFIYLTKHR